MRILYSIENLRDLFQMELKDLKNLTRLGLLPSVEGMSPRRYDKVDIDAWLADGGLEKHKPVEYYHRKGVYEKPAK